MDTTPQNMEEQQKREDQQLMARAQGDLNAFNQLWQRYRTRIVNYSRSILSDPALPLDAEDATTKAFWRAWKYRDSYRPKNEGSVYGWLCTIARNECLSILKAERHKLTLSVEGNREDVTSHEGEEQKADADRDQIKFVSLDAPNTPTLELVDPTPNPNDDILFALLEACRKRFAKKTDRLMIRLHYQHDFSAKTIAEVLEENENTVKSHMTRRIKPIIREIMDEILGTTHAVVRTNLQPNVEEGETES